MNQNTLYQDKDVIITTDSVVIKCYFFPFGNSKTIKFNQIKAIQMKPYKSKGKLWGMNVYQWGYWMPGDLKRWNYHNFIAVQTGSSITPSFTCTDMEKAYKTLVQEWTKYKQTNQDRQMKEDENKHLIKVQ